MDVKENPMEESIKYHIPEEIPANERTAFHGAAAAAAVNLKFGVLLLRESLAFLLSFSCGTLSENWLQVRLGN